MVKKRKMITIDIEMPRVVVNTLIKKLNKPRPSVYNVKPENINKLRNAIDTLFLDGECGILRNNEIIINDEEVEYTEEQPYKFSDKTGKYVGSGLSVLGVKNLVIKGDFLFHCNGCDTDMAYTEYKGRKNFNFRVLDDLRLDIGYCNNCSTKRINKWHKENPEYLRNYAKERSKTDILFKLIGNIRIRTNCAYKATKWIKESKNKDMLGCSLSHAKHCLEIQFTEGMSWDNWGKWHIDHIIPLSSANTEEELSLLCHYKNLQPLWAFDNLSKNGKYNKKEKAEMIKTIINCKQYQKQ